MTEALLIVNPSSGEEMATEYATKVAEILKEQYDQVTIKETQKAGDAQDFAKTAARNHIDAVFVMGGDGTVNEGVSGLAEEDYRPDFGFIPLGTVNDLGRALGISMNPEEAIEELRHLKKEKMDVGKINDHYFIDVVAVGVIPRAVSNVDPDQKTRFGAFAYFMEGAKALRESECFTFHLTIDGEELVEESMMLLVSLSNSVGGFEKLVPQAKVDDGKLHLTLLKGNKLLDKLALLPKVFSGEVTDDQQIVYRAFEKGHIAIKNDIEMTANVDGDEGDALPLDLMVLPQHLTVLVPGK